MLDTEADVQAPLQGRTGVWEAQQRLLAASPGRTLLANPGGIRPGICPGAGHGHRVSPRVRQGVVSPALHSGLSLCSALLHPLAFQKPLPDLYPACHTLSQSQRLESATCKVNSGPCLSAGGSDRGHSPHASQLVAVTRQPAIFSSVGGNEGGGLHALLWWWHALPCVPGRSWGSGGRVRGAAAPLIPPPWDRWPGLLANQHPLVSFPLAWLCFVAESHSAGMRLLPSDSLVAGLVGSRARARGSSLRPVDQLTDLGA